MMSSFELVVGVSVLIEVDAKRLVAQQVVKDAVDIISANHEQVMIAITRSEATFRSEAR